MRNAGAPWITAVSQEYDGILGGDLSENSIVSDAISTHGPMLEDLVAVLESGLGFNVENFVESRRDVFGSKQAIHEMFWLWRGTPRMTCDSQ